MSVKNRLKEFIKSENITISAFEQSIKASNGYVSSISKSIGNDKLELISEKYPKLNILWLLLNKGEMTNKNNGVEPPFANTEMKSLIETNKSLSATLENISATLKNLTNQ